MTSPVADSALYRQANLQQLAQTHSKWIPRVPATVNAAQTVLAQADPQAWAARTAGYRYGELTATYGGLEQRWGLIYAESRRAQAHRAVANRGARRVTKNSKP
jgi:transposase